MGNAGLTFSAEKKGIPDEGDAPNPRGRRKIFKKPGQQRALVRTERAPGHSYARVDIQG